MIVALFIKIQPCQKKEGECTAVKEAERAWMYLKL